MEQWDMEQLQKQYYDETGGMTKSLTLSNGTAWTNGFVEWLAKRRIKQDVLLSWAENEILQLPEDHEGRNKWLSMYRDLK